MEVIGQFDAAIALSSGKEPSVSIEYQAGRGQSLPGIERRTLHCAARSCHWAAYTSPATEAPRKGAYKYLASLQ
jgi:hypothetical protein